MKSLKPIPFLVIVSTFLLFSANVLGQLTTSKLPIVVITTTVNIPDEPKIEGKMGIIWNGDGKINSITDPYNHYDGAVGIEIRGQTSQQFPKKSYGIELWDAKQEGIDFGLLGFPEEEDFVFHGPYSDKSLMRNALAYYLASKNMAYAPRIKFFELILNDEYVGVYLLTEKIKRDTNRVDIKKIEEEDISGDKLTGGYIMRFDKGDPIEVAWESPVLSQPGNQKVRIMYDTPDYDEMTPQQFDYIKGYIDEFETVLSGDNFADPATGYAKYIDENSFIDFTLINEIGKNVDGYRLSSFFYKDRESIDGRIKAGPVWDFNLAFGNANYCEGGDVEGWALDFNSVCTEDYWQIHFWWTKLWEDPAYVEKIGVRWRELRKGAFSNEKIMFAIDSMRNEMGDATTRNFQKWNILNEYVWPNNFPPGSYEQEVTNLKKWTEQRLAWLDLQFDIVLAVEQPEQKGYKIYPNPASGKLTIEADKLWNGNELLRIYNTFGQEIRQFLIPEAVKKSSINFSLAPGLYIYQLEESNGELIGTGKLIVN